MPELPFATFSGTRRGLFSPEEVRRLMEVEYARARRYRYPLSCLMIAIDRLQELAHLYGEESRREILEQVVGLLRGATRSSDFMGYLLDERLLAIFPHTEGVGCAAVARRLVQGARKLAFDGGGPVVSITLSIGLSHLDPERKQEFQDLLDEASGALALARSSGGNQLHVFKYKAPPPPPPVAAGLPDEQGLGKMLERLLHEKLESIFASQGQTLPDFGNREKEVVALAVRRMEEEHEREMGMLQRRLAKLSEALGMTENDLRRAIAAKSVDSGIASIYSTVQGLADDEAQADLKREMMSKIFEANVEMRKQMKSR
jgi:diguanylate cyclase (GGDEF)-like protein